MISVIIPTYKSPEYLDLCLESAIKGQQNKNQIIVVVDGHYDINNEVLNKHSEHIDILNIEQNVGLCKGTNLGVMNARYDKVLIVNDDNVFPTEWDIILQLNWVSGAIISPNQIEPFPSMFSQFHINDLGKTVDEFNLNKFWEYEKYISKEKQDGFGSTLPIFMSKLDYLKIGGWDENYQLGMVADWDFFLKANLNSLALIRLYNLHFYHFASASTNGESRIKAERSGHEYAKYKWGGYIQHDPESNKKFID
jgi:O-antigen biosynthesis protein|tara:strand:+ start:4358 stop:5113 length:756 start_codon:yes stop_codon:yes gene_type:complete